MADLTYLATPLMTAASTPSPFVVTKSTEFSSTFAAWKAWSMKHGTSDCWLANATTGWVAIDLGASLTIAGYMIASCGFNVNANPKTWTFQGSNDGSSWTTLDTQTNYTSFSPVSFSQFTLGSSVSYRYYKLDVTVNNGNASFMGTGPIVLVLPTPSAGGGMIGGGNLSGGFQ